MFEGDGASSWVKLQTDTVKVTVDATIFKDREEFGLGLVARDSNGGLIQAKSVLHQSSVVPELAEVMAVKEALSWVKQMRWEKVVLESHSLVTVQAIRSRVSMRSPFSLIVEECRRKIEKLNNFYLYFIRRSANMVANHLVRASYLYPGRIFDRSTVTIELKNCTMADCLN